MLIGGPDLLDSILYGDTDQITSLNKLIKENKIQDKKNSTIKLNRKKEKQLIFGFLRLMNQN
jgi:hypothetical protein